MFISTQVLFCGIYVPKTKPQTFPLKQTKIQLVYNLSKSIFLSAVRSFHKVIKHDLSFGPSPVQVGCIYTISVKNKTKFRKCACWPDF